MPSKRGLCGAVSSRADLSPALAPGPALLLSPPSGELSLHTAGFFLGSALRSPLREAPGPPEAQGWPSDLAPLRLLLGIRLYHPAP